MLKEIKIEELTLNPVTRIGKDYMLVTAGNKERGYNTMTAGWGQLGAIWGLGKANPTSVIFIRPERYTKEFVDREAFYTLSFFPEEYKKALMYLGSHSGRDEDKVSNAGLSPVFDGDCTYFAEASLVLFCRKLYRQTLSEDCFIDKSIVDKCYPDKSFHDMYIGEITKVLSL